MASSASASQNSNRRARGRSIVSRRGFASAGRRVPIVVGMLLILAPLVWALAAPGLARVPAAPSGFVIPPLPESPHGALPSVEGAVDPLPIVIRDLPDDASRRALAVYDAATVREPGGLGDAYLLFWTEPAPR